MSLEFDVQGRDQRGSIGSRTVGLDTYLFKRLGKSTAARAWPGGPSSQSGGPGVLFSSKMPMTYDHVEDYNIIYSEFAKYIRSLFPKHKIEIEVRPLPAQDP